MPGRLLSARLCSTRLQAVAGIETAGLLIARTQQTGPDGRGAGGSVLLAFGFLRRVIRCEQTYSSWGPRLTHSYAWQDHITPRAFARFTTFYSRFWTVNNRLDRRKKFIELFERVSANYVITGIRVGFRGDDHLLRRSRRGIHPRYCRSTQGVHR